MATVVMDAKCHQALREAGAETQHYGPNAPNAGEFRGKRLTGLRDDLISENHSFDIVDMDNSDWLGATVLIIAGRSQTVSFT